MWNIIFVQDCPIGGQGATGGSNTIALQRDRMTRGGKLVKVKKRHNLILDPRNPPDYLSVNLVKCSDLDNDKNNNISNCIAPFAK